MKRLAPLRQWARSARAEILTGVSLLVGWLLISAGLASLCGPVVWWFSFGLLGVSLGGWKLAWAIVTNGLYELTRDEEPKRG